MFGLAAKLFSGHKTPLRKATFKPHFETLENREVMSVASAVQAVAVNVGAFKLDTLLPPQPTAAGLALINGLPDTPVRTAALTDYQRDGSISRNDMMDILSTGTTHYTSAKSPVFASLNTLVNNGSTVGMPAYVQNLASKTLYDANGLLLGEIKAMQSDDVGQTVYNRFVAREYITLAQDIQMEVSDWFLGQDHPNDTFVNSKGTAVTPTYQAVNLPLWNGSPSYQDVAQGSVGDCWLMASLAEVAARNPGDIMSMFIDNGDHTYTVRFFNGSTPDYVTVDNMLPSGGSLYDHPQSDMWAALAEKAYAQENATGWLGSSHQGVASYGALNSGWPQWALPAITGLTASSSGVDADSVMNAFLQGSFVVLCTGGSPNSSLVVPDHCYALLNYSNATFTLFNPWGVNGGISGSNNKFYPGTINATCAALPGNFDSWAKAGASSALTQPVTISAFVQTDASKPAAGVSNETQVGFHQDTRNAFIPHLEVPVDPAMLNSLAGLRNGGVAHTTAGTGVSGSLDGFFTK